MSNPVVSIGPQGSARYSPPNFAPLAQGMSTLGAGIGQAFKDRREEQKKAAADAALKSLFAGASGPDGALDMSALARGMMSNPDLLADPRARGALNIAQMLQPKQKQQRIIQGPDGNPYILNEDGSFRRALPGVNAPVAKGPREMFRARDGRMYWKDTRKPVLENVGQKPTEPKLWTFQGPKGDQITLWSHQTDEINALLAKQYTDVTKSLTGGRDDLGNKAANTVEGQKLKKENAAVRLRNIMKKYKPYYLSYEAHARAKGLKGLEIGGATLSKQTRDFLGKFYTFQQDLVNHLSLYIKELTGAEVRESEVPRIMRGLPNAEDSPTTFESKMRNTLMAVQAEIRFNMKRLGTWTEADEKAYNKPSDPWLSASEGGANPAQQSWVGRAATWVARQIEPDMAPDADSAEPTAAPVPNRFKSMSEEELWSAETARGLSAADQAALLDEMKRRNKQ